MSHPSPSLSSHPRLPSTPSQSPLSHRQCSDTVSPSLQLPLRSPYFRGPPNILRRCPITLVLSPWIPVSNTPSCPRIFLICLIFLRPHLPYFCLHYLALISISPTLGSYSPRAPNLPSGSHLYSVPISPISELHLSGAHLPISFLHFPGPICLRPRAPNLPSPVPVSDPSLDLISPNPGPYLTILPTPTPRPQSWLLGVFPGRKEIRRSGGAAWTVIGGLGMAERLHETGGSDGDLDQGARGL